MQSVTVYPRFIKLLSRSAPLWISLLGYLAGCLYCASRGAAEVIPAPGLNSAFDSRFPVKALITCFSSEFRYIIIIYMLGYCVFGRPAVNGVLAFRSFLSGFSATCLLAGPYPLSLYLIHGITGITGLAALILLGFSARAFVSVRAADYPGGHIPPRVVLDYSAVCLFYAGGVFACVLSRQLLLALVP